MTVLLHTGLRKAEFLGLCWGHVDFKAGVLTIPRTKNGEARHVPMNASVRDILARRPRSLNREEKSFPEAARAAGIEDFRLNVRASAHRDHRDHRDRSIVCQGSSNFPQAWSSTIPTVRCLRCRHFDDVLGRARARRRRRGDRDTMQEQGATMAARPSRPVRIGLRSNTSYWR